jgi:hypothetical protein
MLAHHAPNGEHAVPALLTGSGRLADLGNRPGTGIDGLRDLTVADHGAVAEDHGRPPE